jgi:plastocyanin
MMRRLALIPMLALAAAVAAPSASPATTTVKITRTAFVPQKVTIKTGNAVRWTNADTINHQVVSNNGTFVSPVLGPGKSYTFKFNAAGTYRYHDGLHPSLTGTIVVTGPPPAVSIGASLPIIVYGQTVTLSGVVSTHQAGQSVALYAQPYPQGSLAQITTVLTGAGGVWSYIVKPTILTSFQARWKGNASQVISVGVQPKIAFSKGRVRFATRVTAATSYAGHSVYVQRLSRFGEWVKVAKIKLGKRSGRYFTLRLPRGVSRLRVFMTVNQAGPGYLAGYSRVLTVRRR